MQYMREWHLDSLVAELRDMSVEQLKQLQLSDWKTLTGGALKANIVFNVLKPKNLQKKKKEEVAPEALLTLSKDKSKIQAHWYPGHRG